MQKFKDIEDFYKENELRRRSGETDFGVWWKAENTRANFRVTWVEKTGEFYISNQWTQEIFLASQVCKTREESEAFMQGWSELEHIERKVERYFSEFYEVYNA